MPPNRRQPAKQWCPCLRCQLGNEPLLHEHPGAPCFCHRSPSELAAINEHIRLKFEEQRLAPELAALVALAEAHRPAKPGPDEPPLGGWPHPYPKPAAVQRFDGDDEF